MKYNIVGSLLIAALGVTALTACSPKVTTNQAASPQYTKDEIGKIAADYLVEHPDFLVKASQNLQRQQMEAQQTQTKNAVTQNLKQLTQDPQTPAVGPKDAKVTVVELFDYQCAFCSKLAPAMEKLIANNPNVRFVFQDFPIFASRWPASRYAAEMGMYIYTAKGSNAYLKYHNAIFDSGKDEGKLTSAIIDSFATQAGINLTKAKEAIKSDAYNQRVDQKLQFGGNTLGLRGTPAVIVSPTDGKDAAKLSIFPGYAEQSDIQAAIDKAAS